MRDGLYRVISTTYVHGAPPEHVCAGFVVENGEVVDFAPRLRDKERPRKIHESWKRIAELVEMPLSTGGFDVAFTGPQVYRPDVQVKALDTLFLRLAGYGYKRVHIGDCLGSDVQAWGRATQYFQIIIHPPIESCKRAFLTGILVHEPLPYLDRNHAMVDASHVLVAAPSGPEQLRSGTWATVRYARKMNKPVYVVWNNGVTELIK